MYANLSVNAAAATADRVGIKQQKASLSLSIVPSLALDGENIIIISYTTLVYSADAREETKARARTPIVVSERVRGAHSSSIGTVD